MYVYFDQGLYGSSSFLIYFKFVYLDGFYSSFFFCYVQSNLM